MFTGSTSYIREHNNLAALLQSGGAVGTADHTVNEFQIRGTAYYNRQYGATLGYSMLGGTSDAAYYGSGGPGGSATGDPASSWWTLELNYLPMQDLRFSVLYQNFTKINGGSANFDGLGNNARDQNRLTGAIWFAF